jgi:hypothetical protein
MMLSSIHIMSILRRRVTGDNLAHVVGSRFVAMLPVIPCAAHSPVFAGSHELYWTSEYSHMHRISLRKPSRQDERSIIPLSNLSLHAREPERGC